LPVVIPFATGFEGMAKLSVCILTHNSMRTIEPCLLPAMQIADEMLVVDSGSTDGTIEFLQSQGVSPVHRPYDTHAQQMNFATGLACNDWVLCLDSDEFIDPQTISEILRIKNELCDEGVVYRITRYWCVLGREVRNIYPVSSPDKPVRLFNRRKVHFNDQPVDDKPTGYSEARLIPGHVVHDTFFSVHELFAKLNTYTTRLVEYRQVQPSLFRACGGALAAFFKWYFRKGGWRDGARGVVAALYAMLYTFLKYFKAWCKAKNIPLR
jgi:glycosyltransferase involved in cell wall biosynthesis